MISTKGQIAQETLVRILLALIVAAIVLSIVAQSHWLDLKSVIGP